MCLDVDFFLFILVGLSWASWICGLMIFVSSGQFSAIVSSNILYPLLSPLLLGNQWYVIRTSRTLYVSYPIFFYFTPFNLSVLWSITCFQMQKYSVWGAYLVCSKFSCQGVKLCGSSRRLFEKRSWMFL